MKILTNKRLSEVIIDAPSIVNHVVKLPYTTEDVYQICNLFATSQLNAVDTKHLKMAFESFWNCLERYVDEKLITAKNLVVITLFRHDAIFQLSASSNYCDYPANIAAVTVDWNTGTVVSFRDGCHSNRSVDYISCTLCDESPEFVLSPEFTQGSHLKFKEFIRRTLFHVNVMTAKRHPIVTFNARPLQSKTPELYRKLVASLTRDEQFASSVVWVDADTVCWSMWTI